MFSGLLCPASLAALRALALWLLWPCLKTAPTAFAFVPAIRFSTSGGLYGGNTKEQKTSKKLLKKQTKVMNTFQVIMHTCIKWPWYEVGPQQTCHCQPPLSSGAALVPQTSAFSLLSPWSMITNHDHCNKCLFCLHQQKHRRCNIILALIVIIFINKTMKI